MQSNGVAFRQFLLLLLWTNIWSCKLYACSLACLFALHSCSLLFYFFLLFISAQADKTFFIIIVYLLDAGMEEET